MLCDLALLQSASRFDLSGRAGRNASARWLSELFVGLVGRILKPRLVLELGAAEASFSRRVAPLFHKTEVHALEANPYVFRKHLGEAEQAGVFYHHLAVGDAVREATLKIARKRDGAPVSATKTNNSFRTRAMDVEYEDAVVPMVTVDHFVAERSLGGRTCAMWVDVEGLALEVLTGAGETLKSTLAVMVEVEDKPMWIGQRLSGDVQAHMFDAGFIPVARDFEYESQYNLLFLARSALTNPHVRLALETAFAQSPVVPSPG